MADRTVSVTLRAKVDSYIAAMRQAGAASGQMASTTKANLSQLGSGMTSVGKSMTLGVTAPLAALGGLAVKAAGDFNNSFTRMTSLAGVAGSEIDGLKSSVMGLAGETGRGPNELAEALYFLRSSGLEGAEAMEALEASAQASAAGLGDTATVADVVSSAMNAYATSGMDAAEAMDVLVATARAGKAEPAELAASLGRVLPVATELGVTFQDVGGAVASFSQTGSDASGSVTLLSNVLMKLLKPSQQANEMLAGVGMSVQSIRESIQERGLLGTLQMLSDKLGANNLPKFFEDAQAVAGVMSLLGQNAEGVQETFDAVNNSQGSLSDAFQSWLDGPGSGIAKAFAEIEAAMIKAGEQILPVVADIMSVVGDMAEAFGELPGPVQTAIVLIGGLAALAGPLLIFAGAALKAAAGITAMKTAENIPSTGGGPGGGFWGNVGRYAKPALGLAASGYASWQMGEAAQQNREGAQGRGGPRGGRRNYGDNPIERFGNRLLGREQWTMTVVPEIKDIDTSAAAATKSVIDLNSALGAMAGANAGAAALSMQMSQIDTVIGALAGANVGGIASTIQEDAAEMVEALESMARSASEYQMVTASTDWGAADFAGATTAMSEFNEGFFGLSNIAMESEAAYDALGESIKENGLSFDLSTEKGRANQSALQDLAATLEGQFVSAYDNANGSLDTFMATAEGIGMGVIQTLQTELGLSAEKATELAEKLGLTAGDYEARFALAGVEEAKVRLDLLGTTIGLLQEDVQREVAMRIATGDFQGALDLVQANIAATPDSHNTVMTATDVASAVAFSATGNINATPDSHSTRFTASDVASAVAFGVAGAISTVPRSVHTTFSASVSGIDAALGALRGAAAAARTFQGLAHFARGGLVGPGGGVAGEAGPELAEIGGRQMVLTKPTYVPQGAMITPFSNAGGGQAQATSGTPNVQVYIGNEEITNRVRVVVRDENRERDAQVRSGSRHR